MKRLILPMLCLLVACSRVDDPALEPTLPAGAAWQPLDTPSAPGSGQPRLLTTDDGRVLLSWIEPRDSTGHTLRFSAFEDGQWTPPQTVAAGNDWFVNWADFPSLVALDDGSLAAHYLVRHGGDPHAYDIHIVRSADGGRSWSAPVVPHRDGVAAEHGFVSMLPGENGDLLIVWLDGRAYAGHSGSGQTALRTATLRTDGTLHDEIVLDDRTCDCCPTTATRTRRGVLVAYRDRSDDEIRDIALVQHHDGRWTPPKSAVADNWQIEGCPVNGPALDARGGHVALAWFTAADEPRVQFSFSEDNGATWTPPVAVHETTPLGRTDVVLLDDRTALVSWLETSEDGAVLRVRRVRPGTAPEPPLTIARVSNSRQAGMPQFARTHDAVFAAWTEPGASIRAARWPLAP